MRILAVYIAWPLMAVTFEMATRSGQVAAINLGQLFPALIPEVSLPSFVPGTLSESFSFDVSDIISPIQYEWLTVLCDDYDRVSQCLLERDFPVSIPRCTVAILGQIRREICPLPVAGKVTIYPRSVPYRVPNLSKLFSGTIRGHRATRQRYGLNHGSGSHLVSVSQAFGGMYRKKGGKRRENDDGGRGRERGRGIREKKSCQWKRQKARLN